MTKEHALASSFIENLPTLLVRQRLKSHHDESFLVPRNLGSLRSCGHHELISRRQQRAQHPSLHMFAESGCLIETIHQNGELTHDVRLEQQLARATLLLARVLELQVLLQKLWILRVLLVLIGDDTSECRHIHYQGHVASNDKACLRRDVLQYIDHPCDIGDINVRVRGWLQQRRRCCEIRNNGWGHEVVLCGRSLRFQLWRSRSRREHDGPVITQEAQVIGREPFPLTLDPPDSLHWDLQRLSVGRHDPHSCFIRRHHRLHVQLFTRARRADHGDQPEMQLHRRRRLCIVLGQLVERHRTW